MLDKIKTLLGITGEEKNDLLTLLIDQATEEALLFTHNNQLDQLETAIIKMVIYNYNRLGTEGVDSESYSGVSFAYSADYPETILRLLKSKRKIVML